jgi:hypothetical protein
MTIATKIAGLAAVAALSIGVAAPSVSMASEQGRNTLLGGAAGAGAGALLTHGSVGGTLIGAAGGALIGNAVSSHKKHYRHYSRRSYYHRGY